MGDLSGRRDTLPPGPVGAGGPRPGGAVGKYRVVGELGRGGMGVVYEAEDPVLERRVALKVLGPQLAASPEAARRFLREARAAARLSHANVVAVHDVDEHDGLPFLVMELVPGGSAQARLDAGGRLGWREATRLTADACRGLEAAHAAGLIHRDIKPANLMLGHDGAAKLGDFGLAQALDGAGPSLASGPHVLGTPHFMSPEQCRSEPLDARSDVYALGATYFALLTGRPPFATGGPLAVMFAHCSRPVPDPREDCPDVPEACAAVVRRATAREPSGRYAGAAEMLADLEAVLAGAPGPSLDTGPLPRPRPRLGRRAALAAGGAAALALIGGGVAYFTAAGGRGAPPGAPDLRDLPDFLDAGGPLAYRGLAFAARADLLAWALDDAEGTVVLWDLAAGRPRRTFQTRGTVQSLALSPNGGAVAVTCNRSAAVWDTESGARVDQFPGGRHRATVCGLAFAPGTPDGRTLAVGLHVWNNEPDPTVVLWDCHAGRREAAFPGVRRRAQAVAFSPDGRLLAAGGDDDVVRVWDRETGRERHAFSAEDSAVASVSFSGDGRLLAAGGFRKELPLRPSVVKVWDLKDGRERPAPSELGSNEAFTALSPAEPLLAACSGRKLLWDADRGRQAATVDHAVRAFVRALAFSRDGRLLALAGEDRRVHLVNVDRALGR